MRGEREDGQMTFLMPSVLNTSEVQQHIWCLSKSEGGEEQHLVTTYKAPGRVAIIKSLLWM